MQESAWPKVLHRCKTLKPSKFEHMRYLQSTENCATEQSRPTFAEEHEGFHLSAGTN